MPTKERDWWSRAKRRAYKIATTKFTFLGLGMRGAVVLGRLGIVAVSLGAVTNFVSPNTAWYLKVLAYVLASIVVVLLENGIQTVRARLEKREEREHEERFRQVLVPLNGAIEEMRDGRSVLDRVLITLEQNVKAAVSKEDDPVSLCANLMRFDFRKNELSIVRWGSRRVERIDRAIPIDETSPLPGAARAFIEQRMVYIPDTHDPEIAQYFIDRPYRSILSIPVRIKSGRPAVIGVVNIDSSEKDYFKSDDFIRGELQMIMLPFVNLISLELQKNTVREPVEAQNG